MLNIAPLFSTASGTAKEATKLIETTIPEEQHSITAVNYTPPTTPPVTLTEMMQIPETPQQYTLQREDESGNKLFGKKTQYQNII